MGGASWVLHPVYNLPVCWAIFLKTFFIFGMIGKTELKQALVFFMM